MTTLVHVLAAIGVAALIALAALAVRTRAGRPGDSETALRDPVDRPYYYWSFRESAQSGTNADGMWTRSARERPADRARILLLGGSVARSGQYRLSYEQTVSFHLESALNRQAGSRRAEVVNGGMTAFVVEQEFLFYQLVAQRYAPDAVVTLDGYNDLLAFAANRPDLPSWAPLFYREFRPVAALAASRRVLASLLPARAHTPSRAAGMPSDDELDAAAAAYLGILDDLHAFVEAKGARHVAFLQPVRWYAPTAPARVRGDAPLASARLYERFERGFAERPWAHSLAALFDDRAEVYIDDCHVTEAGTQALAAAIASRVEAVVG